MYVAVRHFINNGFHPTPTNVWHWYNASGNYLDSGSSTFCFGDSAFLKQENSEVHHFYQSSDTVLQNSFLPYLATASDSLFLTSATLKGCTATDTLVASVLPKPTITLLSDSVFCQNQLPVSLPFSAQSTGTLDRISKMQVSMNGISSSVNDDRTDLNILQVGTFPVSAIATTILGCTDTLNFVCTIHPNPQIAVADTTSVCENDSMQINVIIQTPYMAHLYWTVNNITLDSTTVQSSQNNAKLSALLTKSYHITLSAVFIADINGCEDTAYSILKVEESPKITFATDSIFFCANDSIRVPVFVQSNLDYTFYSQVNLLVLDSQIVNASKDSLVLTPKVGVGSHSITANASNTQGCSSSDTSSLVIRPAPQNYISATDICEGDSLVISIFNPLPQLETVTLWVNNVVDTSFSFASDSLKIRKGFAQGTYTLTLIANNSYNCKDTTETTAEVLPKPIAHLLYSYVSGNNASSTYLFTDSSQFHRSFALDFGLGLEQTGSPYTSYQKTFSDTGLFKIRLIAYQGSLCSDTASIELEVKTQIQFYFPNAISSNSDGLNEQFIIVPNTYIKELNLSFYTRWGEKIMEISAIENLKDQIKLPEGVYFVEGAIVDLNKRHIIKSTLTVLK